MVRLDDDKYICEKSLILLFNKREAESFGVVYSMFYNELYYFANKLYRGTEIDAADVVQDVFINIWDNKKQTFKELINIKAYLYVSIKNNFKNFIVHEKYIGKYKNLLLSDKDKYFSVQIAETETISMINHAVEMLPDECAKVFKLYLDGWSVRDIANELGKTESTVYTQRTEAINLLKSKLRIKEMLILLSYMKFYM